MYKILWIDDEAEGSGKPIIEQAAEYGFEFIPFLTSVEGMKYLSENYQHVDGIVLDANVFFESVDEMASEAGLQNSQIEIAGLESKHGIVFPKVILTGHFDEDQTFKARQARYKVFSKSKQKREFFSFLKNEIKNSPEAQLKVKYADLYEATNSEWFEADLWERFLSLLDVVHNGAVVDQGEKLNSIRRILERVCGALSKGGVIPEVLVSNVATLSLSSLFIGGGNRAKKVELKKERKIIDIISNPFPKAIAEQVRLVNDFTGIGSHEELNPVGASQKFSIASYNDNVPVNYLLHTVTFMVADIVLWTVAHLSENSDIEANMSNWCLRSVVNQSAASVQSFSEGTLCKGEVITNDKRGGLYVKPDFEQGINLNAKIEVEDAERLGLSKGDRVCVGITPFNEKLNLAVEPITKI